MKRQNKLITLLPAILLAASMLVFAGCGDNEMALEETNVMEINATPEVQGKTAEPEPTATVDPMAELFPDEILREAVGDDYKSIKTLYLRDYIHIQDLTGIENLENLEEIYLGNISNDLVLNKHFDELLMAKKLDYVYIIAECKNDYNIDDIKAISSLNGISITFSSQEMFDETIEYIAKNNFKYFKIDGGFFSSVEDEIDISIISEAKSLEFIDLYSCSNIVNLSSLLDMDAQNIKHLGLPDSISNKDVRKICAAFPEIESLAFQYSFGIDKSAGPDLAPLVSLKNLRSLDYSCIMGFDITPICNIESLECLKLDAPATAEFDALYALTNLKELTLSTQRGVDILNPIRYLEKLESLTIISQHVSDLTPISALPNLERLTVISNSLTDISPIAGLKNLKYLDLSHCSGVTDYSALDDFTDLFIVGLN